MSRAGMIMLVVVLSVACQSARDRISDESTGSPYRIVEKKEISFGRVRRWNVRVSLAEHYPRQRIEEIAKVIVGDITNQGPVNAISVMFFGPGTSPNGGWDVASVDWAPNGKWGDSDKVSSGDYASFRYSVTYKPPPTQSANVLKPSGRTGLLGAPLPEGANLIRSTPGDATSGRDPRERYEIQASADAIVAFFYDQMRKAGWLKDGLSESYMLLFRKGEAGIAVLVDRDGGTFTLMGS